MFLPHVVQEFGFCRVFDKLPGSPSQQVFPYQGPEDLLGQRLQLIGIFPALTQSSIAEWYQDAHGKHSGIALEFFGLALDKRADAGIFIMVNEVPVEPFNKSIQGLLVDLPRTQCPLGRRAGPRGVICIPHCRQCRLSRKSQYV